VGVIADVLFFILVPRNFPYVDESLSTSKSRIWLLEKLIIKKIDFLGAFLLLGASVLLVAAFENAGLRHPWKSALVAAMLAVSGVLWICFFLQEWKITRDEGVREPVFPWRFIQSRVTLGMLL
jgi:hypothetical protein